MELNELARKINKMKATAQSRGKGANEESLRIYIQGFTDALDDVATIIKQAKEAERVRQRLARLESSLSQEPVLDLSRMQEGDGREAASDRGKASDPEPAKHAAANSNSGQDAA